MSNLKLLLNLPVRILRLDLEESPFYGEIQAMQNHLRSLGLKHLHIEPYFSDAWFCPDQSASIAIPFYLANNHLRRLAKKFGGTFCDGLTKKDFRKLIYHEAGHCFDHAYQLDQKKTYQRLFGNPEKPYRTSNYKVSFKPYTFVENLSAHYGQCHPNEDFAETFAAMLLNPKHKERLPVGSPAFKKVEWIEYQIKICGGRKPVSLKHIHLSPAHRIRRTVKEILKRSN